MTNQYFQLAFLLNTAIAWRQRPVPEREALLADPWAFKAFLLKVPDQRAVPMRLALLHFVFPSTFEMIVSRRQIVAQLASRTMIGSRVTIIRRDRHVN